MAGNDVNIFCDPYLLNLIIYFLITSKEPLYKLFHQRFFVACYADYG